MVVGEGGWRSNAPSIDALPSKLALKVGFVLYQGDSLLLRAAQMINDIIWLGETADVDATRFLGTGIVDIMDILLCDGDATDEEHTGQ